uniref:von Willebrand factor A domain containing 7 n=1 Tax=Chelonoidis abingdonii TaxID=106734 RepID=A0A8C0IPL3_CHEAB
MLPLHLCLPLSICLSISPSVSIHPSPPISLLAAAPFPFGPAWGRGRGSPQCGGGVGALKLDSPWGDPEGQEGVAGGPVSRGPLGRLLMDRPFISLSPVSPLTAPLISLPARQDFYSHSNWVELGHRSIHPDLLQPGRELGSIAGADVWTCCSCTSWTCEGNLLGSLQERGLLTSGYFGSEPEKPPGKCSHGGQFDSSRLQDPQGGINKDSSSPLFSPHHYLHGPAASLALEASARFLRDLRRDLAHDKQFMRLLDVSPAVGLSFVLDTTGSMSEEIGAARLQARDILTRRLGGAEEPDFYLLVPFHDPGFGPVYKTSNADEFLRILNSISPLAGGDEPEMCLSALQLALLHSPPMSEIFVFTDASAKDAHLRTSVEALIQERRCKVTFLITEDPSRTRVRREVLAADRFDLYVGLAHSSGGQVIFTDNDNIWQVAGVIGETTASSVWRGDPGVRDSNLRIPAYAHLPLRPAGTSQTSDATSGPLGTGQRFGTFHRLELSPRPPIGLWTLEVQAQGNYSVHVRGEERVKPGREWGMGPAPSRGR